MKKYIVPMIKAEMLIEESFLMAASPVVSSSRGVTVGGSKDKEKTGINTGGQAKDYNVWEID